LNAIARQFGASLMRPVPGGGFRTFASDRQNGFVGMEKCFVAVSREAKIFEADAKKDGLRVHDVTRLKYPWPNVGN